MAVTASDARKRLFPLIAKVNEGRTAIEITSKGGNAVLMPMDEYEAWQETAYLFRNAANARRILDAIESLDAGYGEVHDLDRSE